MTMDEIKERLEKMERNSIRLKIEGEPEEAVGSSHFGGEPDVPCDFIWPVFETDTFDDKTVKPRPLSFIAQFNCQELAAYDTEGLLPKAGVLSFFMKLIHKGGDLTQKTPDVQEFIGLKMSKNYQKEHFLKN